MASSKAVNTQSTLTFDNDKNRTSTSISTNILIMVNNTAVGAIQSLSVSEKKPVKMIDEVGTDGHIDSVPNQSANITGNCTRVRFDRLRISEAFGRGFLHVAAQAYPFDIVIIDRQKKDQGSQISTVIKNVWITGIDYNYQANDWVIVDTMSWEAEHIYSFLSGNNNAATGGERQIPINKIDIEQETDRGANGRRGSLDASGLIDLGASGDLF
jgi:hypothetical protein